MHTAQARVLVVDDEPTIRTSMSLVLAEVGYQVQTAGDGFSALSAIRQQMPEVLISDLNMPGMSGYEFLSVVRRRFPMIQVIAMSGAFHGDEVPSGIAADAFYQKGSSMGSLLRILGNLAQPERMSPSHGTPLAPIWIHRGGQSSTGEHYVSIPCPDCLRTFQKPIRSSSTQIHETACIYCMIPIHYAIVPPMSGPPLRTLRTMRAESNIRSAEATQQRS